MKRYSQYKDSGIQWIGEIPNHWEICSVRSYAQEYVEKNKPEKTRELLALSYALGVTLYSDKQYNMDRVKENYEEYKIVHENVLVVSPNDIIKGSAYVSKYYGCISPMYITFKSRFNDPTYLYYLSYLLRTKQAGRTFFSLAKGLIGSILDNGKYVTRRMSVSRNDLLSFKVVMPPLSEQRSIVALLDKNTSLINAVVANKEKEIELLQELKQKTIAEAVTKGLNPDVNMKDSGISWIGMIPEYWEMKQLRSLLTLFTEKGHGDAQLLSVTREQGVILRDKDNKEENHNFVPEDLSGYKYIEKGDFAINKMKAWQGSYAVSDYNGIVSPAYFTCKLKGVNKDFFSRAIRSKAYIPFFTQYSKGIRVDQWDLNPNALKSIPFIVPPVDEQQTIVSYVDEKCQKIDTLITELQAEIDHLNEYKQRLIADVVTGQVNVQNL